MNLSPDYLDAICEKVVVRLRAEASLPTFGVHLRLLNIPESVDTAALARAAEDNVRQALKATKAAMHRGVFTPKRASGPPLGSEPQCSINGQTYTVKDMKVRYGEGDWSPTDQAENHTDTPETGDCPADAFADGVQAAVDERDRIIDMLERQALTYARGSSATAAEWYSRIAEFIRSDA